MRVRSASGRVDGPLPTLRRHRKAVIATDLIRRCAGGRLACRSGCPGSTGLDLSASSMEANLPGEGGRGPYGAREKEREFLSSVVCGIGREHYSERARMA
jgi:hypothetical protein